MFDVDGSGDIDASEFGAVAGELGVQMNQAEVGGRRPPRPAAPKR